MLYLASETEVLILTPGSASWSTLRVDASRRRRGFLREMIGPTPRMLGGGWTIAGAVARCKPIPDPIVAVVSSRKRAVHSPGATAAQRALESYKTERRSCRSIHPSQHIRVSACGMASLGRERSARAPITRNPTRYRPFGPDQPGKIILRTMLHVACRCT